MSQEINHQSRVRGGKRVKESVSTMVVEEEERAAYRLKRHLGPELPYLFFNDKDKQRLHKLVESYGKEKLIEYLKK